MEIIQDKRLQRCMEYPVGFNMEYNLPIIKHYISIIKKEFKDKLDDICLVCTGSSGAIIAAVISSKLKCPIIYVRKDNEDRHHEDKEKIFKPYTIVVDDFICTGNTLRRIQKAYPSKMFDLLIVSSSITNDLTELEETNFKKVYCGQLI